MLAGVTLPANANVEIRPFGAARQTGSAAPQPFGRVLVSGVPRGNNFGARDFGRRQALAPVTASIMLRYNRQAELDALVAMQSNRRSPVYRHFLTSAQFNNYFAPTTQQQAYVIANLQAAGFHITHTFRNRTLLDVVGTSAAAERFFNTEMHSFSQDRYGERFANVTPATVPANLAPLVRSVILSNLIMLRTGPRLDPRAGAFARASAFRRRHAPSFTGFTMPAGDSANVTPVEPNLVDDPGFESGSFGHGWNQCSGPHAAPLAQITNKKAYAGKYSAFAGSLKTSAPEQAGYSGVCQLVTIPRNGMLSARLYQLSTAGNTSVAGQDVELLDTSGAVVVRESTNNNHAYWILKRWSVAAYAGRKLYIYFGVHGDGDLHKYTQQYVDDVSLTGTGTGPAPTPTPKPTATPTVKPTMKPTAKPTAQPTGTPTSQPTAVPTSQPTATPTAQPPTATPTAQPPTATPTAQPPTATPTAQPPTATPTAQPPTATPTAQPTFAPTSQPTLAPTTQPTLAPTAPPTVAPTAPPTATPTAGPVACNSPPDAGPLSTDFGYLATGVASAFEFPVQNGCNGSGTTVADVIDSPIVPSDLTAYLSASGVTETGTVTDVPVDGGATEAYDNVETSLDVETIAGLAPGANIRIYDMPDLTFPSTLDAYNQVINENLASVVNSSFGGCEDQDATVGFPADTEAVAEQGAAIGITFVGASGNLGSNECTDYDIETGVQSPSGDPYFVSVGGDNFTEDSNGNLLTLTATGGPTGFQSGGGVSDQFRLPDYQYGVSNVIASGRNQPDVSLPGVDVAIYSGGGSYGGADGTGWSSACFVALLAEATQLGNTRFGFVNPSIYQVFYFGGSSLDFTDVTMGSNGLYSALTGYDQVTGLGAPKGYSFAQALVVVQN